jgi:hypothetical protein
MASDGIPELASKLVLAALSTAGSLTQSISPIRKGSNWGKQAKAAVGPLGKTYAVIIKIPLLIYKLSLALVIIATLIILITGGMILYQQTPLPLMSAVFGYAYWLPVLAFALIVIVYLNLLSLGLLHLAEWFDHLRFNPGWVNADWQLNHYKDFFAMNINVQECERLTQVIYADILPKKEAFQQLQAPQPQKVDRDELANYLLFKCFAESWIYQQKLGFDMVDKSQKYLAWAAETKEHPFKPEALRQAVSSGSSLYEKLTTLPEVLSSNGTPPPPGELPSSDQFATSIQHVLNRLVKDFDGEGSRLAIVLGFESPYWLLRRLDRFVLLSGPEAEAMRRLYLKLSIRMNVWPTLKSKAGPLLYPQNKGIAILFLNMECLTVADDTKQIDTTDEGVWKLVASAEDRIVASCYNELRAPGHKDAKSAFTQAVFKCDPQQLDLWQLSDYIDLWLFTHTRKCAKRKPQKEKAATAAASSVVTAALPATPATEEACPILTASGTCYCEEATKPWRLEGSSFVKE